MKQRIRSPQTLTKACEMASERAAASYYANPGRGTLLGFLPKVPIDQQNPHSGTDWGTAGTYPAVGGKRTGIFGIAL